MTYASNFWEFSNKILYKIEGPHYLKNKFAQNSYLLDSHQVTKNKYIFFKHLNLNLVFYIVFYYFCKLLLLTIFNSFS